MKPLKTSTTSISKRSVHVSVKHTGYQYREHNFGSLGFEHLGTRTWPYLFYGPDTAEIEVPYHAYMTSVERP
jgi:hypothetical protein